MEDVVEKMLQPVSRSVVLETLEMIDQLNTLIKELGKNMPFPEKLKPKGEIFTRMILRARD